MLKNLSLDIDINGFTADLLMQLSFTNESAKSLEISLSMGLGSTLFVHGLEVERDGLVTVATIQKKQEALNKYDDAISMGHTGALGTQSDTGDFDFALGNLASGKSITVRVKLVGMVKALSFWILSN